MIFYGDPANKNEQVLSFVNPVDYYNFSVKYLVKEEFEDEFDEDFFDEDDDVIVDDVFDEV